MKKVTQPLATLAAGLAVALLASCSGSEQEAEPAPAPTATVTVTESSPAETDTNHDDSDVGPDDSEPADTPDDPEPAGASDDPEPLSVDPGAERVLTMADAFSAENWEEASFQPVNQSENIQAMAATVGCSRKGEELEFRFAQNSGELTFDLAQDMSSDSSDELLEWALEVDGRQVETKKVAFKDSAQLTTPLSGVAVVKLQLSNPTPCTGSAVGLVTKATIKG